MHDMLVEAVTGFFGTMGIKDYPLSDAPIIEINFEQGGLFNIEDRETGTDFYVTRPVEEYQINEVVSRALELCHYHLNPVFDVQTALFNDEKLIFLIWCPHTQLSVPKIESILMHLISLHDKVFNI